MSSERIHGFPPVYSSDSVILICGSMPSVVSLENSFYYAHPRNAFWPMLSSILNEPIPSETEEKSAMLIRHRIALWDTIESCERSGSLDSAIRNPRVNDFDALFKKCPQIRAILFNGACAMNLYKKYVRKNDPDRVYYRLPSTSPAYTMPYTEKYKKWNEVLKELIET